VTAPGRAPHVFAAALCLGLAVSNVVRGSWPAAAAAGAFACGAIAAGGDRRLICAALVLLAWWWGSERLQSLDRSVLLGRVDTSERARIVVTAPPRKARFELRVPGQVRRFGRLRLRESVLLELPPGRAPPQGAILEAVATVRRPRPAKDGFDERTWLRRHGIHVVLRADRWRLVGRRGGLGGLADRLRAGLAGTIAPGLRGDRRGIVEGVVLGDEQALSEGLRDRFRASGLYHLLSVAQVSSEVVAPRRVLRSTTRTQPRVGTAAGRGHRPGHLEGAPTVYVRSTQDASAGARSARSKGEGERRRRRGRAGYT
jgi:predicted membrane metal-binding protein